MIRNRDVLVVSGAVGSFGEGSARVLLQFILHMVHRALIRQQELPEPERARVALKVDEAHLLFCPTFARMLAMDRSAGLECVAAWQSLGQIEDRDLRSVILNLLRHRFVFSVADDDARELANMLQTVYADVIRDDQPARARDAHHPRRADAPAQLPRRLLLDRRRRARPVVRRHDAADGAGRAADRAPPRAPSALRGAHYPGPIPPPNRLADYLKVQDLVPRAGRSDEPKAPGVGALPQGAEAPRDGTRAAQRGRARRTPRAAAGAAATPPTTPAPRTEPLPHRAPRSDRSARLRARALVPRRPRRPRRRRRRSARRPGRRSPTATPSSTSTTRPGCAGRSGRPVRTSRRCRARTTSTSSPRCTSCASCSPRRSAGASCPAGAARSVQHRLSQMFKAGWVRRCEITTAQARATASASTRSTRPATS